MSVPEPTKGNIFRDKSGTTPEQDWDTIWGFFLLTPVQWKANFFPSDYPPPDFEHLPTIQLAMRNVKFHLCLLPNNQIQNNSLS